LNRLAHDQGSPTFEKERGGFKTHENLFILPPLLTVISTELTHGRASAGKTDILP